MEQGLVSKSVRRSTLLLVPWSYSPQLGKPGTNQSKVKLFGSARHFIRGMSHPTSSSPAGSHNVGVTGINEYSSFSCHGE